MSTNANICHVCNEPVEAHTDSLCGACGQTFHLNQREDMEGKDCGEVWINPDHFGIEFTCQVCIDEAVEEPPEQTALDTILDLSEAAALAGISEDELRTLAAGGEIAHRETSGGLLLFERAALQAIQGSERQ